MGVIIILVTSSPYRQAYLEQFILMIGLALIEVKQEIILRLSNLFHICHSFKESNTVFL